jgi:hypothetical protein
MASDLISQDVVPIGTGYLILMGVLAAGLRLQRRDGIRRAAAQPGAAGADTGARDQEAQDQDAGDPDAQAGGATATAAASIGRPDDRDGAGVPGSGGKRPGALARRVPAGWPRLAVQVASVALGGYILLMAVDVLYYYGVARVAGQFIDSAVTGGLTLMAVALPLFGLASWLTVRRHRRAGR